MERSPEHMFMLSGIAPACHSRFIDNDYVLNCNVSFDGCTCCSAVPNISVPLTIIPLVHMESYGCQGPEGYEPIHLGTSSFEVNHHYHGFDGWFWEFQLKLKTQKIQFSKILKSYKYKYCSRLSHLYYNYIFWILFYFLTFIMIIKIS